MVRGAILLIGTLAGIWFFLSRLPTSFFVLALTHMLLGGNFVILHIHLKGLIMPNLRLLALVSTLLLSTSALAQPRSISNIVNESDISAEDEAKIEKYAIGWAEELQTTDADVIEMAHKKLANPFDTDVRMTPHGRSLYGKYLGEGFAPLLDEDNENEMAAVNALQIYALLGTEQGCSVLIKHAHASSEKRDALRLWASIGLGTTFLVGELPQNRVERYAKLLRSYIANEEVWYVLSRQFDALAAIQNIPGLDKTEREEMELLSFTLQTEALVDLLGSLQDSDSRVQALSLVLISLRMQLNEPSVDPIVKRDVFDSVLDPLLVFMERAASNPTTNAELRDDYGRALQSAGLLITGGLDIQDSVDFEQLWNAEQYDAITTLVDGWKTN